MAKSKHKIQLTPKKIKTIILSLAIAIVLTGFVILFIQSIHPSPQYEDFCGEERIKAGPLEENQEITQEICEANNGEWINQDIRCVTTPCPQGYCDYYAKCQKEYDIARNRFKLTAFIITIIAGLVAISIGIILMLPSVSSGLMLGGTFLTFYGIAIYWTNLSNILKTLILGAVLIILIWLGYRKLQY